MHRPLFFVLQRPTGVRVRERGRRVGKARVNLLASRSRNTRNRRDMSSVLNVSVSILHSAHPLLIFPVTSTPLHARPDVLQAASPRPLERPE